MKKQLHGISELFTSLFLIALCLTFFFAGCSRESADREQVIASVNKELISLRDFQKDIAIRSKQNPSYRITPQSVKEQLDTSIDRKLMIQEAMKMGLTNNEDFVRTIQTFWEQTLIRELIEAKSHEWADRLFVSEDEIRDYYEEIIKKSPNVPPLDTIYDQLKKAILEQKKTDALDAWLSKVRKSAVINVNEKLMDKFVLKKNQTSGGQDAR